MYIYEKMNGTQKAAALLVILGKEAAAEIMQCLDEDAIQQLALEIARIQHLPIDEQDELLGEFLLEYKRTKNSALGGENFAKKILTTAFGDEKASQVISKVNLRDLAEYFDFFRDADTDVLVSFLSKEHPQTIAVALAYMPATKAADIIKALPPEMAKDTALKMARMGKTNPEAVMNLAKSLKMKYDNYLKSQNQPKDAGGINALASIINHLSGETERNLLNHFEINVPQISEQLKDRLYTFDSILKLDRREVRILIEKVGDDVTFARALKGAGDELRFHIVRSLSTNRATDLLNDMDELGPLRLTEIESARHRIVSIMRDLQDIGLINLKKDKEIYIE